MEVKRLAFLLLCLIYSGRAQVALVKCDTTPPSNVKDEPFPDIFTLGIASYQLNVELNYEKENQTSYFTEYYDIANEAGRVDSFVEGQRSTFLYFNETKEAFVIQNDGCENGWLSDTPEFMKNFPWNWMDFEKDRILYGPSAMFRTAYLSDLNNPASVVYQGKELNPVRGMSVHRWRQCNEGVNVTIDYYFTDPDFVEPYGFKGNYPVRVRVSGYSPSEGMELLPQSYEIAPFQPYVSDLSVFEIPAGLGCGRMIKGEYLPNYKDKDMELFGEIVYRTEKDNSEIDEWKYIQYVHTALDFHSEHLAYEYTPWKETNEDLNKEVDVDFSVREIFDFKRGILYTNGEEIGCALSMGDGIEPKIKLPDSKWIALSNPLIFLGTRDFQYLGEKKLRGFDVTVHEQVFLGTIPGLTEDPDGSTVVTRYYLKEEVSYSKGIIEKGIPIQTQMKFLDKTKKLSHTLIFNIFAFTTYVENKPKLFDVSDCFPDEDDITWFTAVFPGSEEDIKKAEKAVPEIERGIVEAIIMSSEATPLRMPTVLIDFDQVHIYATVKLIGRPPTDFDFNVTQEKKVLTNYQEIDGIVMSEDDCALRCLEILEGCWGYSYCGATCYLTTNSDFANNLQDKEGCKFQGRHNNWIPIPSITQLEKDIRGIFKEEKLTFDVRVDNDETKPPIFFTAKELKFSRKPPTSGVIETYGYDLDDRFAQYKPAKKLKVGSDQQSKSYGKLGFTDCQKICLSKPDCQSVSYCTIGMDCVLSTKHGDEIKTTDMDSDTRCEIFTRKYSEHFVKYPGLVLSTEADRTTNVADVDSCARECIKETGFTCKSYEFCANLKDSNCKLHKKHFLDARKENGGKQVTASGECVHYSRKYIMDFTAAESKREETQGKTQVLQITPEECAKECAENVGFTCVAFDFKPDDPNLPTMGSCILSQNSDAKLVQDKTWTRYTRAAPKDRDGKVNEVNPNYSNSLAGGLGFFFFLIGGALGAGGLYAYAYFKVNRQNV